MGEYIHASEWKALKKIDAHIHIVPDAVHRANPDAQDVWRHADVHRYREIMSENNIERAVIMPLNDPFLMSMEFTAEAVHRELTTIKAAFPGQFYAFADVDVRSSAADTLDALRRAADEYCLDGIKLHPNNSGMAADSDYNNAVFAFAEERGIPVAIHSYPDTEDDVSAARRIVRIAGRYPALKLIVCHMGAMQWKELLPLGCLVDLSAILPVYVRTCGIAATREIVHAFGARRLLFATDYPDSRILQSHEIYPTYFEILGQMQFTQAEAERIAYANARALFDGRRAADVPMPEER